MTTAMPLLKFNGISKAFFGIPVLKGINLSLHAGQVLGLIGENGAGKSTLMNVLGGVLSRDGGEIHLGGRPYVCDNPKDAERQGISFIHQELNLFPNLTVAENVFISNFPRIPGTPLINAGEIAQRTSEALARVHLKISPNESIENLPAGERQLVEIAKALAANAKIIILDEPTTSLTTREIARLLDLMRQLRNEGVSMIFISHALQDVKTIADEIAVLRDGEVITQEPAAQLPIDRMVALMVGRQLDAMYPPRNNVRQPEVAFEVRGITQPKMVKDVSFSVQKGEILGVFGLMGAGRSELLRILFGLDPKQSGTMKIGGRPFEQITPERAIASGMAFVTESRREDGLLMDLSVLNNVSLVQLRAFAKAGFLNLSALTKKMLAVLKATTVKVSNPVLQPIRSLSGGNQQKVVIGKWMAGDPSFFMLDEPTRGVDVGAKYDVYTKIQHLAQNGAAVLVVSSEIEELIGICDRILVMSRGELTGEFDRDAFDRQAILHAAFGGKE